MTGNAAFDDLAGQYDRYRPRYPASLADAAIGDRRSDLTLVDAGAGTGISLEWIMPHLRDVRVHAIDISQGMVEAGRSKFPHAAWHLGQVEDVLPAIGKVDLIIAGQAYQWFDRPAFLTAAKSALSDSGRLAVIQNNRDHANSGMLSVYEDLLEQKSPGYSRSYRVIDIQREIAEGLELDPDDVGVFTADWTQTMSVDDFVGMSSSSTQVQRAIQAVGNSVLDEVRELAHHYERDSRVQLPYRTELFVAHL